MDRNKIAIGLLCGSFGCFFGAGFYLALTEPFEVKPYIFVLFGLFMFLFFFAAIAVGATSDARARNTYSLLPGESDEAPLQLTPLVRASEASDQPQEDVPMGQVADSPMSACAMMDEVLGHRITSTMTCVEIVDLLKRHGCVNLTPLLDPSASSAIPLAQGGLGDVFRGRFSDGTPIAIKTIRAYGDESTGVYQKRAAKEVYVWSRCSHKNVARMIGLAVFNGSLAMISRWEANGSMTYYLSRKPSVDRCQLIIGVCVGMTYLHDNNIVHGDLRGANVLIDQDGIPMLTDFGNATLMNATLGFTESRGGTKYTTRWAAPEILNEGTHTTASDVYSLGMTILETLTSAVPFDNLKSDNAVIMHVISGKAIPPRPEAAIPTKSIYGNTLWDILTKCWSYDPMERPSAGEVWEILKPLTPEKLNKIEDEGEKYGE